MRKYRISVEHCGGGSVEHSCTDGVYSDPSQDFDGIIVEADSAITAIHRAVMDIAEAANKADYCNCNLRYAPGTDKWWDSLTVDACPVEVA